MSQARVTTTALEVLVAAEANARISSLALEVLHSVQEGAPPPPPPTPGRRRAVVALGALAERVEGRIEWDGPAMRATNRRDVDDLVTPEFRKGWEIG